ncbi:RNA polymerase sigma factor SigM [Phytoactinopolyspora halotolerans]|uniref:RNA polymerase sigma factor SigM n=1 Tax=Phytoactinopolyspora halotolerans TaxID=1981512 RepID=A0A6L9S2M9_9ACTN|nr:RNA polymerase sigma factor SigM [Phytoactinopolyspora halotolerans]NED98687.1 RNA polymerase sigma factor SigM [Phytoactinopolyspora halotolerans]
MTGDPAAYQESDDELLKRHTRGEHDAFGELVRRHQDRLWAVALRTLGNPDEAADALQDALVNAFRRASSFRSESAVTTWLHRIVVNACLDRVRHTAARPADPTPFDGTESPAVTAALDPGPDPAERTAVRLDVETALASLPDEQRVPLVLVDMEGYRVAEVAEMLGLPAGTIKSRCARARARLVPLLSAEESRSGAGNQPRGSHVSPETANEQGGERR